MNAPQGSPQYSLSSPVKHLTPPNSVLQPNGQLLLNPSHAKLSHLHLSTPKSIFQAQFNYVLLCDGFSSFARRNILLESISTLFLSLLQHLSHESEQLHLKDHFPLLDTELLMAVMMPIYIYTFSIQHNAWYVAALSDYRTREQMDGQVEHAYIKLHKNSLEVLGLSSKMHHSRETTVQAISRLRA